MLVQTTTQKGFREQNWGKGSTFSDSSIKTPIDGPKKLPFATSQKEAKT